MADVFAPQPVKTKVAGDVVVNINAGQTVALSTGAATIGAVNIAAAQTLSTVTTVGAVTAITNALPTGANTIGAVNIAASQTLATVTTVGAVTAITNALPTGANTIGAVTIAAAQTLATVTTVGAVTAITNALPAGTNVLGALSANQSVNTTQLGGVAVSVGAGASSTGTQRVILATDQATLPVSQGLSFVTGDSGHLTSAALAAGATVVLDGPQIASGVAKLFEATVTSSVALKAQLGTWDGTTFVVKRTFFVLANASLLYEPSRYDAITMATGATAKFRWSITNNDNANAADVYASITQAI